MSFTIWGEDRSGGAPLNGGRAHCMLSGRVFPYMEEKDVLSVPDSFLQLVEFIV